MHAHTHTHKVRKLDAGFSWDRKHCEMRKVFSFVFKDKKLSSAWDQGGVTVAWLTDILIIVQNYTQLLLGSQTSWSLYKTTPNCCLAHRHPDHCTKLHPAVAWLTDILTIVLNNTDCCLAHRHPDHCTKQHWLLLGSQTSWSLYKTTLTVAWLTDILIIVLNNTDCCLTHRHPDHCTKQHCCLTHRHPDHCTKLHPTVAWLTDILITVQNNIQCCLIHGHPDHCTKQHWLLLDSQTSWPLYETQSDQLTSPGVWFNIS